MTNERYCEGPECDRRAFRGATTDRPLCETHTKQWQRTGRLTPIAPELTEEARAIEAGVAFLDEKEKLGRPDDDTGPMTDERRTIKAGTALLEADEADDSEYEARRRAFLNACVRLGIKKLTSAMRAAIFAQHNSLLVRQGQQRAKRRGVRLGRPPKLDPSEVRRLLRTLKSPLKVAKALGVHEATIHRYKRK